MNKKVIIMIIAIILVVVLIGLVIFGIVGNYNNSKIEHPTATIEVEGYETPIVIELYPEYAPNTVKNFVLLAQNEFYNKQIVHRVEKDFVIQTGDPKGNGTGGPTISAIDKSIEKDSDADKEYGIKRRILKKRIQEQTKT